MKKNESSKHNSSAADIDNELFEAMQEWDQDDQNPLGFYEEDEEYGNALIEGGGTPPNFE